MNVPGAKLVRVGRGVHSHLYDTKRKTHSCRSGINAGRQGGSGALPVLHPVSGTFLSCYRCIKLANINLQAGRKAWDSGE